MNTQKIVDNILGKKDRKVRQKLSKKQQIYKKIEKDNLSSEEVSPNRINLIANELGINLTSSEVVEFSDNYRKRKLKQSSECWHVEFDDGQIIEFPAEMATSRDQAMKVARDQKKQMPGIYAHHLGRIVKAYKKRC